MDRGNAVYGELSSSEKEKIETPYDQAKMNLKSKQSNLTDLRSPED